MSNSSRTTILGENDSGAEAIQKMNAFGHSEISVQNPRLPFGSIHTESITPLFQIDGVYGINSGQVETFTSGSGSITTTDSSFSLSTGTTINSESSMNSKKRLRYRPGQGVIGRHTAIYTSPVANSYQIVGYGHSEDGYFIGYKGTQFGIIHNERGVREVQTLTITTASSTTENITVTLDGVAHSIAVTNSANIQRTVWEVSQGVYSGWKAEPSGSTIIFVADKSENKTSSFSISGTTIVGSFAETRAGAAANETFIPQSDFNVDKCDGTGKTGFNLDPTKGNVFQIKIQYLGFGAISFEVEIPHSFNNPEFVPFHIIKNPNKLTKTTVGNPSFPFYAKVYSTGSTTNLNMKIGSLAGFIEGQKQLHGNRLSYFQQLTTVGAANLQALFTIINSNYYGSRSNQSVINIMSVSGAIKHLSPVIFYLIKNGSLVGNPNFTTFSSVSCSKQDTASTTVTYTNNEQLVWTGHLGDTGEIDHSFSNGLSEEITLQPGEWITLAAKATTGSPSWVTGSINTREDQ